MRQHKVPDYFRKRKFIYISIEDVHFINEWKHPKKNTMANYIFFDKSYCHVKKSNSAPKKEYKEKMFKNNTIGSAKESRCEYSITYPESIMASAKRLRFKDLVRLQLNWLRKEDMEVLTR